MNYSVNYPEPRTEPDDDYYVVADCGHEVYEGESLYEWENKTLCPDCFREEIEELSNEELAVIFNVDYTVVGKRSRRFEVHNV